MFLCRIAFRIFFLLFLLVSLGPVAHAQTFTLNASAIAAHPGDQNVPLTVTATTSDGFSDNITVVPSGLPSGVTVTPAALSLPPGSSGVFSLSFSLSADAEDFDYLDATANNNVTITRQIAFIGISGGTKASAQANLTLSLQNDSFRPAAGDINLPIVTITTSSAITSTDVSVPGTVSITSADGQTSYLPSSANPDNTASFQVHGNSTALMPKLPYNLKLNTSLDLLGTMGLSCPYTTGKKAICDKSKSYVLIANYDDKAMLRDWAASALANSIPAGKGYISPPATAPSPSGTSTYLPWAPHSLFVELFVNGVYMGVYQLTEKPNVDSHRVNITELGSSDITDDITGGYQLQIDARLKADTTWRTGMGLPIDLEDPDLTPAVPEQVGYIQNYVNSFEAALASDNFTDPKTGWRAYMDEASAIDFYLVNDIMGNQDGGDFFSSDYFYKAKGDPLLYMGPVWDFDISAGNINYSQLIDAQAVWMQQQAIWYRRLFQDPQFKANVTTQFNALKNNGVFTKWLASVQTQATALQQAQKNNYRRWPNLGIRVWPNLVALGDYNAEVAYMTTYIQLRIGYLDTMLNGKTQPSLTLVAPTGPIDSGAPVTLTSRVSSATGTPSGTVSFRVDFAAVASAPVGADGVATVTTSNILTGSHMVQAVYSGDSVYGMTNSPTVTVSANPAPVVTTTTLAAIPSGSKRIITVTVVSSGTAPIPTGLVKLTQNGSTSQAALDGTGTATFNVTIGTGADNVFLAGYAGDTANQASTSSPLTITASKPQLAFTVPSHTFGDAPFAVNATSASTGLITYSVVSGPATINGNNVTLTGTGTVVLQATQAADESYAATSRTASFIVTARSLTIAAGNATRSYGMANPAFTGSVAGAAAPDVFTETFTTTAVPLSPAGTYAIVPAASGTNIGLYTQTVTNGTLTITRAHSSLALTAGTNAVASGTAVTFTVLAASTTSGVPTGDVVLYDNGQLLSTVALSNGAAVYTTPSLAPGFTHNITASYTGDANFVGAAAAAPSGITVAGTDPSFTLPGALSAAAGRDTPVAMQLTPVTGAYPAAVQFAITGLPSGATASFSPATLSGISGPTTANVTLHFPAVTGSISGNRIGALAIGLMLLPLTLLRRRRGFPHLVGLGCFLVSFCVIPLGLTGCGASDSKSTTTAPAHTAQTYNVVVTATSNTVIHTANVVITVQ